MSRDERHVQILEAAAEVIATSGLAACTLEEVANAVGASRATIYKHFANRDELLTELMQAELKVLRDLQVDDFENSQTLEGWYEARTPAYFKYLKRRGRLLTSLFADPVVYAKLAGDNRDRRHQVADHLASKAEQSYGVTPHMAQLGVALTLHAPDYAVRLLQKEVVATERAANFWIRFITGGWRAVARTAAPAPASPDLVVLAGSPDELEAANEARVGSARRAQILDAAADVLVRTGRFDFSPDEVAKEIGVSRALVYKYFPTREFLIHELMGRELRSIRSIRKNLIDPRWRLRQYYRAQNREYMKYVCERGALLQALSSDAAGYDTLLNETLETHPETLEAQPETLGEAIRLVDAAFHVPPDLAWLGLVMTRYTVVNAYKLLRDDDASLDADAEFWTDFLMGGWGAVALGRDGAAANADEVPPLPAKPFDIGAEQDAPGPQLHARRSLRTG